MLPDEQGLGPGERRGLSRSRARIRRKGRVVKSRKVRAAKSRKFRRIGPAQTAPVSGTVKVAQGGRRQGPRPKEPRWRLGGRAGAGPLRRTAFRLQPRPPRGPPPVHAAPGLAPRHQVPPGRIWMRRPIPAARRRGPTRCAPGDTLSGDRPSSFYGHAKPTGSGCTTSTGPRSVTRNLIYTGAGVQRPDRTRHAPSVRNGDPTRPGTPRPPAPRSASSAVPARASSPAAGQCDREQFRPASQCDGYQRVGHQRGLPATACSCSGSASGNGPGQLTRRSSTS